MPADQSWKKIFADCKIDHHNFAEAPFVLTSGQIKKACQDFTTTSDKEVRILCKHDHREKRPTIFKERGLFIIAIKNGVYAIVEGEGYVDIPAVESEPVPYQSTLGFHPITSQIGNSEMQHLDYAYAASLIRSYMNDDTLILTTRGRKYTRGFSYYAGKHRHRIDVRGVQTEVDAGYESKDKLLLVEAKNARTNNVVIRQLYYPYRQWRECTDKPIDLLFFEKRKEGYHIWQYAFDALEEYNSIRLLHSVRFTIAP